MNKSQLQNFAWGISAAVVLAAIVAWGQAYNWQVQGMSLYQIFPLLGLVAFSLMWAHYVASVARQHFKLEKSALVDYFDITSGMVLVLILAHPSLLAWQSYRDGSGLPPGSSLDYVAPTMRFSVILGMISLVAFLAYEFRRRFSERSWWKYVEYTTDAAIILVYIHALRLGGQLQTGWFRTLWLFYGLTLAACLGYIYYQKLNKTTK